jgi:hypothetical protein
MVSRSQNALVPPSKPSSRNFRSVDDSSRSSGECDDSSYVWQQLEYVNNKFIDHFEERLLTKTKIS